MSYSYISDAPVGALLCSIFLGPLGLQGWLINPGNADYKGLGARQRTLTYVIYGLLVATIIFWSLTISTAPTNADENKTVGAGTAGLAIAGTVTYSALAVSLFVSFIFACILLARKN